MATLKTEGAKKSDQVFNVPPESIKLPDNIARKFDHDDDSIMEMVRSYEERGQDTPVMVRKSGGDVICVFGQRRIKAAVKYNELHPKNPMLISAVVVDDNEADAFDRAVDENNIHRKTSVVDQAFQMKVYREKYKWSDKDIAKKYRCEQSKVSMLKKITTLSEDVLKMLHVGDIALDTAYRLAGLNEGTQAEIVAKVKKAQEEFEEKRDQFVDNLAKDAEEIDKGLPAPEAGNGKDDGEEVEKPARTNNAQPGGKPAKKPTVNEAIKDEIRTTVAGNAEANGKDEGGGKGGKGQSTKIPPPNFVAVKECLADVMTLKSMPAEFKVFADYMLQWCKGKITQEKFYKEAKKALKEPAAA